VNVTAYVDDEGHAEVHPKVNSQGHAPSLDLSWHLYPLDELSMLANGHTATLISPHLIFKWEKGHMKWNTHDGQQVAMVAVSAPII
jgi:hypothetical protein